MGFFVSLTTLTFKYTKAITFHLVKRKSNSLEYCLSNIKVNCNQPLMEGSLNDSIDDKLAFKCRKIANRDLSNPDAGASMPQQHRIVP